MVRPQKAVIDNTVYITCVSLILSVLMQGVFLIVGKWHIRVLLGNFLGFVAAVANFFAMAMTVQTAVDKDEKRAKAYVKISHTVRFACLIVVAAVGCALKSVFDPLALLLPLLFPQVGIMLYPVIKNKNKEE